MDIKLLDTRKDTFFCLPRFVGRYGAEQLNSNSCANTKVRQRHALYKPISAAVQTAETREELLCTVSQCAWRCDELSTSLTCFSYDATLARL